MEAHCSLTAIGRQPTRGQTSCKRPACPAFRFRGRRGDLVGVLWWDGQGLVLYAKRLERGRFVWPQARDGAVSLTPAQLSMPLEGIDWRMPARTWRPEMAG
jgi:transposase